MAAFLPAFALGLQHATTTNDPNRFLQPMMSGAYQNFWQAAGHSFSANAQQEGRKLLDQLFGSDEVSRRVAHQAANYAGINAETMQQLLPLLAGILAGGMSKWMAAHAQTVQTFTPPPEAATDSQASANPWIALWSEWMTTPKPKEKPAANPFEEMMAPFLPTPPQPAEQETPEPSWEDMMNKGREMQMQYLTSLQLIFEDAWKINRPKP
jgi:hypothetical protein